MNKVTAAALVFILLPSLASAGEIDRAFTLALAEHSGDTGGGSSSVEIADDHARSKALLLSVLVPGLGQRYNGNALRSRIFLGLEGAIWAGFIVFKFQEYNRTRDFEEWAVAFADVPGTGRGEEFYRIMTIYDDVDDYNTSVRIEARTLFPNDRDAQLRHEAENSYGDDRFFRWTNNERRLEYRLIRNDARDSGQRADFALVAAVLNRAISAVEAARSGGGGDLAGRAARHIRFDLPAEGEIAQLRLAFRTSF